MDKKQIDNIIEGLWKNSVKIPSTSEIGSMVGLSQRTIERREQHLRVQGKIGTRLDKGSRTKETDRGFKRKYINTYSDMVTALKDTLLQVKPYEIPKYSTKKTGDTLIVHITDWHIGRIVHDEFGNVIFNLEIFKDRVHNFTVELIKLVEKYIQRGTPISDVVIISTGDICDGAGIFASQEVVSELSPPFQVMEATAAIQKLILAFTERNLRVSFYGVRGNHGEIRVNGKSKDPNANWDMMLYMMLDYWVREAIKAKNIFIKYSEVDYMNFTIRGWRFHARHKAPNQSETSAGKARFLGWARKHNCDVLIYGHYHHWGIWDRSRITIIRGGALTSGDEFAETLAEESDPIQIICGCNEKRPITFAYPLDLGYKEKLSK